MQLVKFTDWLTKFSGEDLTILKQSERKFRIRFALVGLFVLAIFLGCFLSCTYAIYSLFEHNLLLSIPIGVFFGWMATNIYLLLLYTLTPNLLSEPKEEGLAALSLVLRLSFITLLAVIIAKPISVGLFSATLEEDTRQYKQELLTSHLIQADSLLIEQEKSLGARYIQDLRLRSKGYSEENSTTAQTILFKIAGDSVFLNRVKGIQLKVNLLSNEPGKNKAGINALNKQLFELTQEEAANDNNFLNDPNLAEGGIRPLAPIDSLNRVLLQSMKELLWKKQQAQVQLLALLDKTSFFVYKTKLVSTAYLSSWLIDFAIVLLFLLPVYWKYKERKLARYYASRRLIEKRIVVDEYEAFKQHYARTMHGITGKAIDYYEPFVDPPFNTIRKKDAKEFKLQEEFLNKIYGLG